MLRTEWISWWVGWNEILKWIDFEVSNHEAVWIVWPNWCGKTSFLNIINWFNTHSSWNIFFDDVDISNYSVEKRAIAWIGRVFQNFWIFKNLTLFENLALAFVNKLSWKNKLLPLKYLPKEYKEQISSILNELDLYKKRNEIAWNISWGQMRLLEIARLYLQNIQLYLLDEPTAWVSPKLKSTIINLLEKIVKSGKMVVIVEHDFVFLWEFVSRLAVINDGKIVLNDKYEKIKNNKILKEVYFG